MEIPTIRHDKAVPPLLDCLKSSPPLNVSPPWLLKFSSCPPCLADDTKIIPPTLYTMPNRILLNRNAHCDVIEGDKWVQNQKTRAKAHSLFIDDLEVYQQNHQKLQVANEINVKASTDTSSCYGVKCVEVVYNAAKMKKGKGLTVLEEKMKVLDPEPNKIYKFQGYSTKK